MCGRARWQRNFSAKIGARQRISSGIRQSGRQLVLFGWISHRYLILPHITVVQGQTQSSQGRQQRRRENAAVHRDKRASALHAIAMLMTGLALVVDQLCASVAAVFPDARSVCVIGRVQAYEEETIGCRKRHLSAKRTASPFPTKILVGAISPNKTYPRPRAGVVRPLRETTKPSQILREYRAAEIHSCAHFAVASLRLRRTDRVRVIATSGPSAERERTGSLSRPDINA
jgi:hypothetical protein